MLWRRLFWYVRAIVSEKNVTSVFRVYFTRNVGINTPDCIMQLQPVTFPTAAISATRFRDGLSKEIEGALDFWVFKVNDYKAYCVLRFATV
jgi:hypothetical protein